MRGAYNAVLVVGDAVGDTLYYGQGAGQMPTASAVVADLIDMAVGRAQRTFQTLRLWSGNGGAITLRPSAAVRSRFYLRVPAEDRPGVLAEVASVLARHHINLQLAKVTTLGERVEDTFLIDGPELQHSKAQIAIETELLEALNA